MLMSRSRQPAHLPSDKQMDVFKFIIAFVEENGFQPSQTEIGLHFKVSKNAVTERLKSLERNGVVKLPITARERAIRLKHVKFKAVYDPAD